MQFDIRVFDPARATVREESVEAESRLALEQRYTSDGQLLLSVQRKATGLLPRRRGSRLDIAWWCRELRTLLMAGMTVVETIETLHAQANRAALGQARAEVHGGLLNRLREGQPLSAAMQAAGCFPAILIAGVKASERTSNLVEALDDFLVYHEMLDRLRKQVISAAIYPSVVVGLGGLITLFLLVFVVPRFSQMYGGLQGSSSWTTKNLMALSSLLNNHGGSVTFVVLLLLMLGAVAWQQGWVSQVAARLVLAITPLQRQIDEFRLAKLYHSLALMFRGGYSLDEALGQCAGLGLGERLRGRVVTAQAALARGQRVSAALGDAGLTDTVTCRLLAVGERSGNFDRILQTIAQRHAMNFSTFVERATRVIEPLLLLLVALLVGGLVVMMYMPIFDIATSIR